MIDSREDYRVTVKVRNANLLRAIEGSGHKPGNEFADKAGIKYPLLNGLISCKESPMTKAGDYRAGVMEMCEFLNKMPCELFSEEQLYPLEVNTVEFDAGIEECLSISQTRSPEELIAGNSAAIAALDSLPSRERGVLMRRLGIGGPKETLKEIGASLGVCQDRVRQIECKALRRLSDPRKSHLLRGENDPGYEEFRTASCWEGRYD